MGKVPHFVALASLISFGATAAWAQPQPSLDLRNFSPPTDPEGSFYLEPSRTPGAGEWNVGAWLSYARSLVTLEDAAGETVATPLRHQLSLDYLASIGLGSRIALGLRLPTVLYQSGDNVTPLVGGSLLPQTAIGDASFGAKATLVPMGDLGGFGLAALAHVTAPTGDRRSYVGEGAATGEVRLLAEANLLAAALRASTGFNARGASRTFVDEEFSHRLPWAVGATFKPRVIGLDDEGRWLWLAEVHGAVAVSPQFASGAQSPALGSLGARYTVGEVSTIAGVELPIGSAVGTPSVRFVLGLGWAPRFYDEDGDGIEDDADECPEYPEDVDGFEDSDGCMDWDNDGDGVGDDEDQCPGQLDDADGFQDDGCPDPDNDEDGILDGEDACPDEPGPRESHAAGCPPKDTDQDGIFDHQDGCPKQPEDHDEFQDADGCPDFDNDRDRIPDDQDACPLRRGPRRSDPKLHGCPSPDRDGDTYDDADDKCPKLPEDFDGVDDEDGCPDDDSDRPAWQRAKPLVRVDERDGRHFVRWRAAPKFVTTGTSVELAEESMPVARALAQLLNQHRRWVVMVGVMPDGKDLEAEQVAHNRAFALVQVLRQLTHRDSGAEPVSWLAVKQLPQARASRAGVLVVQPATRRRPRPKPRGAKRP